MEILTQLELDALANYMQFFSEEEAKEYIYSKAYRDIEFFSDFFLSHFKQKDGRSIATPFFHKEIWKSLTSKDNVNIIIPRGHGKTTCLMIWMFHALLFSKQKNIIYIASSSLGEDTIGKIKRELEENDLIYMVFGKLTPASSTNSKSNKWRQKELELLNGMKIQTLSSGQSIRGKRPTKIIVDDPQENNDVQNRELTDKFNEWFFTSLYNTLLPGNSVCVLGTVIGNLCLVKYLRDKKNWSTIEYKAINDGKALWKDLWSLEELEKRKKILGSAFFNQEFLNIPISKDNVVIKEHWLRYYKKLPDKFDKTILGIDPAVKISEKNDFTGICVMGIIESRKFVIYSKAVKLTPGQLEKFIVEIFNKYSPDIILQESNIEAKLFEDLGKKGLPMIPVRANKDKYSRLLEVSSSLEFGEVFFDIKTQEELCYQLTNFPDVKHDDILDAFIYCLKYLNSQENVGIFLI